MVSYKTQQKPIIINTKGFPITDLYIPKQNNIGHIHCTRTCYGNTLQRTRFGYIYDAP